MKIKARTLSSKALVHGRCIQQTRVWVESLSNRQDLQ